MMNRQGHLFQPHFCELTVVSCFMAQLFSMERVVKAFFKGIDSFILPMQQPKVFWEAYLLAE
jgi:hypothetical protein